MIACCGLVCDSCRIHLATLEKDESKQRSMRIDIARICREQYGMNVAYEDITDCDGCRAPDDSVFQAAGRVISALVPASGNWEVVPIAATIHAPNSSGSLRKIGGRMTDSKASENKAEIPITDP